MADFKFKKKYATSAEYYKDIALHSGYADIGLLNDSSLGYSYSKYLTDLKINDPAGLEKLKGVDTSYLNNNDKFLRYQLATGHLKENEFVDMFKDEQGNNEFYTTFGDVNGYFNAQREHNYKMAMYDTLSGFNKFVNGTGSVLGKLLAGMLNGAEGIVDGIALLGGKYTNDFISQDLFYGDAVSQWAQETLYYKTTGRETSQWNPWNFVGNLFETIPNSALYWIPYAGPVLGFLSSAGMSAEETLKANPDVNQWALVGNSLANATIELVTERMFGSAALGKQGFLKSWIKSIKTKGITRIAKSILEEGFEEVVAEFAQSILQQETNLQGKSKEYKRDARMSAGEFFENIAYAGLLGGIMGLGGESLNIVKTYINLGVHPLQQLSSDPTKKSFTAIEILNMQDMLSNISTKEYRKMITSELETYAIKNDISLEEAKQRAESGDTEAKRAIEKDEAQLKKLADLGLAVASMVNELGAERFNEILRMASDTFENRVEIGREIALWSVANNQFGYKAAMLNKPAIDKYNEKNPNLQFTPLSAKQRVEANDSFVQKFKQLTGLQIIFGKFHDDNRVVKASKTFVRDGKLLYVNVDSFNSMSPKAFITNVIQAGLLESIADSGNIFDAEILKALREMNPLFEKLSEEDILASILSNPETARALYGLSKTKYKKLIKQIITVVKTSNVPKDNKREMVRGMSNMTKSLLELVRTSQDMVSIESQTEDNVLIQRLIDSQQQYLVNNIEDSDITDKSIGSLKSAPKTDVDLTQDYRIYLTKEKCTVDIIKITEAENNIISNLVDRDAYIADDGALTIPRTEDAYNPEFVQTVKALHEEVTDFWEALRLHLYNTYNVVYSEAYNKLYYTIQVADHLKSNWQDLIGTGISASELIESDGSEDSAQLQEILKDTWVYFKELPGDARGEYSNTLNAVALDPVTLNLGGAEYILAHELSHAAFSKLGLFKKSYDARAVVNSMSDAQKNALKKRLWGTTNISDESLVTLLYKRSFNEAMVEPRAYSTLAKEKPHSYPVMATDKSYFTIIQDGYKYVLVGTGVFKNVRIENVKITDTVREEGTRWHDNLLEKVKKYNPDLDESKITDIHKLDAKKKYNKEVELIKQNRPDIDVKKLTFEQFKTEVESIENELNTIKNNIMKANPSYTEEILDGMSKEDLIMLETSLTSKEGKPKETKTEETKKEEVKKMSLTKEQKLQMLKEDMELLFEYYKDEGKKITKADIVSMYKNDKAKFKEELIKAKKPKTEANVISAKKLEAMKEAQKQAKKDYEEKTVKEKEAKINLGTELAIQEKEAAEIALKSNAQLANSLKSNIPEITFGDKTLNLQKLRNIYTVNDTDVIFSINSNKSISDGKLVDIREYNKKYTDPGGWADVKRNIMETLNFLGSENYSLEALQEILDEDSYLILKQSLQIWGYITPTQADYIATSALTNLKTLKSLNDSKNTLSDKEIIGLMFFSNYTDIVEIIKKYKEYAGENDALNITQPTDILKLLEKVFNISKDDLQPSNKGYAFNRLFTDILKKLGNMKNVMLSNLTDSDKLIKITEIAKSVESQYEKNPKSNEVQIKTNTNKEGQSTSQEFADDSYKKEESLRDLKDSVEPFINKKPNELTKEDVESLAEELFKKGFINNKVSIFDISKVQLVAFVSEMHLLMEAIKGEEGDSAYEALINFIKNVKKLSKENYKTKIENGEQVDFGIAYVYFLTDLIEINANEVTVSTYTGEDYNKSEEKLSFSKDILKKNIPTILDNYADSYSKLSYLYAEQTHAKEQKTKGATAKQQKTKALTTTETTKALPAPEVKKVKSKKESTKTLEDYKQELLNDEYYNHYEETIKSFKSISELKAWVDRDNEINEAAKKLNDDREDAYTVIQRELAKKQEEQPKQEEKTKEEQSKKEEKTTEEKREEFIKIVEERENKKTYSNRAPEIIKRIKPKDLKTITYYKHSKANEELAFEGPALNVFNTSNTSVLNKNDYEPSDSEVYFNGEKLYNDYTLIQNAIDEKITKEIFGKQWEIIKTNAETMLITSVSEIILNANNRGMLNLNDDATATILGIAIAKQSGAGVSQHALSEIQKNKKILEEAFKNLGDDLKIYNKVFANFNASDRKKIAELLPDKVKENLDKTFKKEVEKRNEAMKNRTELDNLAVEIANKLDNLIKNENKLQQLLDAAKTNEDKLELQKQLETLQKEIAQMRTDAEKNKAALAETEAKISEHQKNLKRIDEFNNLGSVEKIAYIQSLLEKKASGEKLSEAEQAILDSIDYTSEAYKETLAMLSKKFHEEAKKAKSATERFIAGFNSWRYLSMLSSPSTWVKNITTNAVVGAMDLVANHMISTNLGDVLFKKLESKLDEIQTVDINDVTYTVDDKGNIVTETNQSAYRYKQYKYKHVKRTDFKDTSKTSTQLVYAIMDDDYMRAELDGINKYDHETNKVQYKRLRKTKDKSVAKIILENIKAGNESIASNAMLTKKQKIGSYAWVVLNQFLDEADKVKIEDKARRTLAGFIEANILEILEHDKTFVDANAKALFNNMITRVKQNQALTSEDIKTIISNLADQKGSLLRKFTQVSMEHAKKVFFRNNNKFGTKIQELVTKHPIATVPITLVLPFARMTWNMMVAFFEFSPAGFIKVLTDRKALLNLYDKITKSKKSNVEMVEDSSYAEELQNFYNENIEFIKSYENIITSSGKIIKDLAALNRFISSKEEQSDAEKEFLSKYASASPVFMKSTAYIEDMKKDLKDLENKISGIEIVNLKRNFFKASIGTVGFTLGMLLAAFGALKIDDEDYLGGIINLFGVKVRLSDLGPATAAMNTGIFVWDVFKNGFDEKSITALFNNLLEETIIGFTTDAVEYSDNMLEYVLNVAANGITQAIPTGWRQLGKVYSQQKYAKSSQYGKRFIQNIADALPLTRMLLGKFNFILDQKLDPYTGEYVKRHDASYGGIALIELLNLFSPMKITYRSSDKYELEAKLAGSPVSAGTARFSYQGETIPLDKEDKIEYQKYRATYIKTNLQKLIDSTTYKSASKTDKKKLLERLYARASEYAKTTFISKNPNSARWKTK